MKLGYLMSVTIIPLVLISTSSFYQGKSQDKGKEQQHEKNHSSGKSMKNKNEHKEKGHDKHKHHAEKNSFKKDHKTFKGNQGKVKKSWKENESWTDGRWDDNRFNQRMVKIKGGKKNKWVNERYYPGIVWWEGANYYDVKRPKNAKKVTICHTPNGSEYPVAINVSVNALQAHLNHGDYEGKCRDYDRARYSDTYWETRTNYYNQYVQTTETLSLGEQLLNLAIEKLTNSNSQLNTLRPSLSQQEITRREQSIINLQNDTYVLQRSLEVGNTRVATVNFVL